MSSMQDRVEVPGSHRTAMEGALAAGDVPPDERVEVTVRVRARPSRAADRASGPTAQSLSSQPVGERRYLSRDELRDLHGADPDDLAAVAAFARSAGLEVVESDEAGRRVVVAGPAARVAEAFGVRLQRFSHAGGTYRGRTGPVTVPAELGALVEGVFGLDDRPQAEPHFRLLAASPDVAATASVPGAGAADPARARPRKASSFTPPEVAHLYDFVAGADGSGQTIAIIELGGGFRTADLATYFRGLGITEPSVVAVAVDGATSAPGSPSGPDGEVMLDIEVAGSVAPGAAIAVYFAPNTDRGFLDAISAAVHDTARSPSIISISWGGPESSWTGQAMQAMDQAFQAAALVGITVLVASGDNGSGDRVGDGLAHVDFPASSPHVLGCGGTRLTATTSAIEAEQAWNDGSSGGATGGGVSDVFALPAYQQSAGVPPSANPGGRLGRGVPDLAGDASPLSGYQVRVDGVNTVIGGTSAVAPLVAGLVALINQELGKPVGFVSPLLYAAPAGVFSDITAGSNGAYAARAGWDACTGLGRPDGARLLAVLRGASPSAGGR